MKKLHDAWQFFCIGLISTAAMNPTETEMNALLEPFALTSAQYIDSVIQTHGYSSLGRGETVLPVGMLDAAEYLRLMDAKKELLETAKKEEETLAGYVANPDTIPSFIREKYDNGRGYLPGFDHAKLEMEQALRTKKEEVNTHYNYVFSLAHNNRIIDGEAFRSKMSPLLIKHMETLMQTQHEEAERIVRQRGSD